MLDEEYCVKAINFDLDTKALQQYYPSSNWRKAYDDIKEFLLANGFKHRQGSGYYSVQKIYKFELAAIIRDLSIQFKWLKQCTKQFDITNIGAQYSALKLISNATPDIDFCGLSEAPDITEKLDEIMDVADKIADVIDNGELDLDKDVRSAKGQAR